MKKHHFADVKSSQLFTPDYCDDFIFSYTLVHVALFVYSEKKFMFYSTLDKKKKPTITEDLISGLDIGNQSSYTTPMEKAMAPHSSTLAWKIHGQRSLVGCSPWDR